MNVINNTGPVASRQERPLTLKGLYPATVTPFRDDLAVDLDALERHLDETAAADGVKGLVVNGGVAELLQLTPAEQRQVIEAAVRIRRPGQLVIAGVEGRGANQAVEAGLNAKRAGADALLVLPPFDVRAYRRLAADAASVKRFFAEMDARVDVPLIVFQYPPQSGVSYPVSVLREVVSLRNVVGIKAATATATVYVEIWDALKDYVSVLAAVDSPPLLEMLRHGSHGALIGISAVAPEKWSGLLEAIESGDSPGAEELFEKVCKPLMASIFENQQPKRLTSEAAAIKEALVQLGQIPSSRVRPPAIDVDDHVRAEIRDSLIRSGLMTAGGR